MQPLPYYGKVHAGEPQVLDGDRVGFISMDRRFVPTEDTFFLKVKGESMIGRGINDGDYVMISPKAQARDGDIIAARLGDEATVKTLSHVDGKVLLKAANPADDDILVKPSDDFSVVGVVSGIFRPFFDRGTPDAPDGD